jgi:predicted secreted protein
VLKPETGIITWNVEVPAKGEIKIPLKYEVKYPKDKQVANL